MTWLARLARSERVAALPLLAAAVAALVVANSPAGGAVIGLRDARLDLPALGLHLTVGQWITDGLLAVFFLLAAIELRHEFRHGELDTPRKAAVPAIAAAGGVVVPALVYLLIARDPALASGWPIPTATDIAFALGVLALVGRGLPARIRALLLALAIIDDLIAIAIIAFFFTTSLNPLPLLLAVPVVLLFGFLSTRLAGRSRPLVIAALAVLALAAWLLVHLSGVHATIAGVALGLVFAPAPAARLRHALEPWSNLIILPVFAFAAALVPLPQVGAAGLSPAFWGVAVALPVGKLVGITAGAAAASLLHTRAERRRELPLGDVLVVAAFGGIGFTVSLLMNELAFRSDHELAAEVTLAVLAGSLVSAAIAAAAARLRARALRRRPPR